MKKWPMQKRVSDTSVARATGASSGCAPASSRVVVGIIGRSVLVIIDTYGPTVEQNQFNNFGDRNVARRVLCVLAPMSFRRVPASPCLPVRIPRTGDFK